MELTVFIESYEDLMECLKQRNELREEGRYEEAIALATKICEFVRGMGEPNADCYALSLSDLAQLYSDVGNNEAAERLLRQVIDIFYRVLGKQHPYYAMSLDHLAELYGSMGNYKAAEPLYHEALDIQRETLGERHPDYATTLGNLVAIYNKIGDYASAEPLYRHILNIQREVLGEQHPDFVLNLGKLAQLCDKMGNYEAAEPLWLNVINIQRETLGERHPDYATSLNNLAHNYYQQGNYKAAEPLYHEALDIRRETLGEKDSDYGLTLNNLAVLYAATGDYQTAEQLSREALDIRRAIVGTRHPDYAISLRNLAGIYHSIGNYKTAVLRTREALDIQRETLGERHPDYATTLNNLAALYGETGDYKAAEPLLREALDIRSGILGERHPDYAQSLHNLATLYLSMGKLEAAESLIRQTLDIRREALGKQHSDYAQSLNTLAVLYIRIGDYQAAEPLYREALDILRTVFGEGHTRYAIYLGNLAALYDNLGDYKAAEPLYREAVETLRVILGEKHPYHAANLSNLASLLVATNRPAEAFDLMKSLTKIYDNMIAQIFSVGSESQRMMYLQRIRSEIDGFLSLISQRCSQSDEAIRAAMDLVLRRKALGAEALAAQRDAVLGGKYPHLRGQLQQLRALTGQIAQKLLAGPSVEGIDVHRQRLSEWNTERERIEADLARQIPEMSLEQRLKKADYRVVAQALPEGSVLVEFVRFDVFDFAAVRARGESTWTRPRYLAFVLRAGEPNSLAMIDLGEAETIDRLIADFRAQITGEDEERTATAKIDKPEAVVTDAGADLRAIVFDPLIPCLNGVTHLLIAPDGELTRLPFESLPYSSHKHVVDTYRLSYLSVGRDALRFGYHDKHRPSASLVIADPDFDLGGSAAAGQETSDNRRSLLSKLGFGKRRPAGGDLVRPQEVAQTDGLQSAPVILRHSRDITHVLQDVRRLPATEKEGKEISDLLGVDLWLRQQALEGHLKATLSPRVLHLATHGFFLENQPDLTKARAGFAGLMLDRLATGSLENPLLRSGLVLAGVNTWLKGQTPPKEAEDGVLTALDVSGLDLSDTDLVVLSACETGLGDIRAGEGVFGLRRAVMLAGAKTLVMSLWKVPDEPTKELMIDFYTRILKGEPRAEALRKAQLALKEKYPHPYFWGAFICQGDPGPLKQLD